MTNFSTLLRTPGLVIAWKTAPHDSAESSVTVPQNGALGPYADDESGISILAPRSAITVNSQNGEYIGVDSQFDYRTTALEGTEATLLDPFNASQASLATALNLDFTQAVPGVVTTTRVGASTGTTPTGKMIFTGGTGGGRTYAS